jgi:hypothetical protein
MRRESIPWWRSNVSETRSWQPGALTTVGHAVGFRDDFCNKKASDRLYPNRKSDPVARTTVLKSHMIAGWIERLAQDVRYGSRILWKSPGFTAVTVLSLALGIGANSAVFSLLNAVLLRSLPVRDPQCLRVLNWAGPMPREYSFPGNEMQFGFNGAVWGEFSHPLYRAFREEGKGFTEVFAFARTDPLTVVTAKGASTATGMLVSGNFFAGYGVDPLSSTDHYWLQVMVRLPPGAPEAQARASLEVVLRRVQSGLLEPNAAPPRLLLKEGRNGPQMKREKIGGPLQILKRIVAFVLLIACANVAGLLLARNAARQHELAVRAALGAGRWRLVRQCFSESLVLASAGNPNLAPAALTTQKELSDRLIANERLFASLGGAFAALAVLLSCMGIYGLMAYNVARRTGEIGIRLALGARREDVSRPILREAAWLAAAGAGLGIPLSWAATRIIGHYLYGISPHDLFTLSVAVAMLIAVAVLAAWLPARRAARVNPMVALKTE